jgi:hypothetical protein
MIALNNILFYTMTIIIVLVLVSQVVDIIKGR